MSKRDQLIATATELFARQGYHGTGIDQIADQAKVTKKTLYHHFSSKDELIVEVLKTYDQRFRDNFFNAIEEAAQDPQQRLLAIFDLAEKWFQSPKFFGCMFINAIGEFSDPNTPLRHVCTDFKQVMRDYVGQLVEGLPVTKPDELARQLALLFEGAIVTAQVSGDAGCAKDARRAAEILIQHALANGNAKRKQRSAQ